MERGGAATVTNMLSPRSLAVASATVAAGACALLNLWRPQLRQPRQSCTPSPAGTIFIVGLGYSGSRIAKDLVARHWRVVGTVRTAEAAARLRAQLGGVEVLVFDGSTAPGRAAAATAALGRATHLLLTAQPSDGGDPVLCNPALREAVASAPRLVWVGYLSSVGVYGDCGGQAVDELRSPNPKTTRGKRRLKAEEQWRAARLPPGTTLQIFRLPGIYGPGRGPIEKVRSGTARCLVKAEQLFSRIHVDDIALVVRAAATLAAAPALPGAARIGSNGSRGPRVDVFNTVDNEPAPAHEVRLISSRSI